MAEERACGLTGRPTRKRNPRLPLRGSCCVPVAFNVRRHMKHPRQHRITVLFWALFVALGSIIGLRLNGVHIPTPVFVVVVLVLGAFCVWVFAQNLLSTREILQKSAHPDPDVAALIEERIDIAEYQRRKEASDV